ncbi:MAG TPA: pseudouridine synthase [Oscillospiraceae bacterium]|nr:pseudouridine synthase [Oscillospiraceae bacterium]HPF57147.1 pseudouridine synthase [Clostridiales bacterium]HPK35653.1 pseudouridine synthase [Oscillospiraceae bacterium]HPR75809.1 pseudouridine synthase [Oscillospiraceae bacterium]
MPDAGERIQKLMSEWGICSRRAAEKLIEQGRVKRNGRPVSLGEKATSRDLLTVDGERIGPTVDRKIYIMLNKPRGYVTTAKDELGRKCVTDLVADLNTRLYPVGRLDRDSEGLLLLTNDGAFAQKISHPSYEVGKTYRVTVEGKITPETELAFLEGVDSEGELLNVKRIQLIEEKENRTVLEIALTEGKNRHIRRICEVLGLSVLRLKRIAEGGVKLGGLPVGKYRELTPQEVATLKNR